MDILRSNFITILFFGILFSSCSPEQEVKVEETQEPVPLQVTKVTETTTFPNDFDKYPIMSGVIGVYDVPEMLVLAVLDSTSKKDLSEHMIKNNIILEKEMKEVGAEMNGPIGILSHNADPNNFIFESVVCIKQVPKKQPKRSTIVVLETSKMLIYNFYGPYNNLGRAYTAIAEYCSERKLVRSGPIREFYITVPSVEKDPEKLFTRIFLPVISIPK